jgi:acetyl esterase/lipase
MWFRLVTLTLFALPLLAQIPAAQFTVVSDVQYCTSGGKPLLMDVFLPKNRIRTPTPAVLWIHGGGWQNPEFPQKSLNLLLLGCPILRVFGEGWDV